MGNVGLLISPLVIILGEILIVTLIELLVVILVVTLIEVLIELLVVILALVVAVVVVIIGVVIWKSLLLIQIQILVLISKCVGLWIHLELIMRRKVRCWLLGHIVAGGESERSRDRGGE